IGKTTKHVSSALSPFRADCYTMHQFPARLRSQSTMRKPRRWPAGIELQIKGDGQRYKFFVRDGATWDSMAYAYSFDTVADQWITVRVPFAEMIPVRRARTVPDALPLNPGRIYSMQLMLSKFEYDGRLNPQFKAGEFRLFVRTIGTY
ncbi:MAG: hypothetical protein F6K19_50195, partial [Cyanothece sp. SIO1E1]|nr:hypothetical protein [Cyanothece sp. SIO1E1]